MEAAGISNQDVYVAVRPEGFVLSEDKSKDSKSRAETKVSQGKERELHCTLQAVEVMGRDISVVATNPFSENAVIRAIISSETRVDTKKKDLSFTLKKNKVFLFKKETEERIYVK